MPKMDGSADGHWGAFHFRFTAFPVERIVVPVEQWWGELGVASAAPVVQPYRLQAMLGEGVGATLAVAQGRIDLIYDAVPRALSANGLPTFEDSGTVWNSFRNMAIRLLERDDFPAVKRLAAAAGLRQQARSPAEAVQVLLPKLRGVRLDAPAEVEELMLRWNRPAYAKAVARLRVNRIETWEIAAYSVQSMEVIGRGEGAVRGTQPQPLFAAEAHWDVNTDARREDALPREAVRELWIELAEEVWTGASRFMEREVKQ